MIKRKLIRQFTSLGAVLCGGMLLMSASPAMADVPFTFVNRSTYSDDQVYIAVIGEINGHVWIDPSTGSVREMSVSDNSVAGPVIGGNKGPGNNGMYAKCFVQLSKIPNKTVNVPTIAGSRIYIGFGSPLYFYFFGRSGGYAAPNMANPTDPNQGIRFELIELTNTAQNGIWVNTTRVDAYQHPMGLEVRGAGGFSVKTGEIIGHEAILKLWKDSVSATFQGCLNSATGVISAPSKTTPFQEHGSQENFFKAYIDAIWSKYATQDLVFNSGNAGVWSGRVIGGRFVFHNLTVHFGNDTGIISARPSTQEVLEGKGVLAEDVQKLPNQQLDKVVQAQFCAAVNRHALDLDAASGVVQDWSDSSKYYKTMPYNEYAKFWHRGDISWLRHSYGFCYDDVFEYSSTIHAQTPLAATVTLGGFASDPTSAVERCGMAPSLEMRVSADRNQLVFGSSQQGNLSLTDLQGHRVLEARVTDGRVDLGGRVGHGEYLWVLNSSSNLWKGKLLIAP